MHSSEGVLACNFKGCATLYNPWAHSVLPLLPVTVQESRLGHALSPGADRAGLSSTPFTPGESYEEQICPADPGTLRPWDRPRRIKMETTYFHVVNKQWKQLIRLHGRMETNPSTRGFVWV